MRFAYLVFFEPSAAVVSEADVATVRAVVRAVPRLTRALIYRPAAASDRYNDDGTPPPFGLQLGFAELGELEAAVGSDSPLASLAGLASLSAKRATAQAMAVRRFEVPEPAPSGPEATSYVVHYLGPAADLNAWHAHYIANHPPLMRRFPGVRELEILTRIDWVDALPFARVHHMQRNRIRFDSPAALTAALHSPVREDMRADFRALPPFEGGNRHYAMATEELV